MRPATFGTQAHAPQICMICVSYLLGFQTDAGPYAVPPMDKSVLSYDDLVSGVSPCVQCVKSVYATRAMVPWHEQLSEALNLTTPPEL